jgi:hypothetical protein
LSSPNHIAVAAIPAGVKLERRDLELEEYVEVVVEKAEDSTN